MILKCDDSLFYSVFFSLSNGGYKPKTDSLRLSFCQDYWPEENSISVRFEDLKTNKETEVKYSLEREHPGQLHRLPYSSEIESIDVDMVKLRRRIEDKLRKMSQDEKKRILPTLAEALGVRLGE
jgi:hypothetical protein